ncbi:MAG: PASTA domain-containing protein, partial [Flavobacteriales bacterium]|nr:PASTA domain-containing protein [Flavobacteriales bacterium]
MFRFLISRAFFINLLIAGVLIGGLMWYSLKFLHDYTKHGEIISVPDLTGFVVEDIEGYLEERNLRYEVRDIIYNANKPRGSVLDQDPKPDSWVKENRRIYLIVNATETPKVPMPDLIDETFRRASSILEIRGFKLGKLEIVEEMGNKVTGFKYQGKEIKAGYKVPKGATIDLIMAGGSSLTKIEAPNIIGMVLEEAIMTLKESSLNNANPGWDDNVITT